MFSLILIEFIRILEDLLLLKNYEEYKKLTKPLCRDCWQESKN